MMRRRWGDKVEMKRVVVEWKEMETTKEKEENEAGF